MSDPQSLQERLLSVPKIPTLTDEQTEQLTSGLGCVLSPVDVYILGWKSCHSAFETALDARDAEIARLRSHIGNLEQDCAAYRARLRTNENEFAYLRSLLADAERALEPFARKLPDNYEQGSSKYTLVEIVHLLEARSTHAKLKAAMKTDKTV